MKKKLIVIISILLVITAGAIAAVKITESQKLKKCIYDTVEADHLGYSYRFTPLLSLSFDLEDTEKHRDELNRNTNHQFEMKNIRILEKTKDDQTEYFEELFKEKYNADWKVSKVLHIHIKIDIREKYDFDDNNPLITGEYKGWYEQHKMYNHKWSEWRTEEHMICAIKINGKWYGQCWDDEI